MRRFAKIGQSRPYVGMLYSSGLGHLYSAKVVYLAFYGTPYDANLMLASLGPIAWGIVVIELLVWGFVAISVGSKLFKRVSSYGSETVLSETITPQA